MENGRDIDGLICQWHRVFTLGGLVATLPWLVHPIISSPWLKNFFMPSKLHHTGSGHVMSVCERSDSSVFFDPKPYLANFDLSGMRECSSIDLEVPN